MSSEGEIIRSLTACLLNLRDCSPNISLRVWFDEERELKFFFTNSPGRKTNSEDSMTTSTPSIRSASPRRKHRRNIEVAPSVPPEMKDECDDNNVNEEVDSKDDPQENVFTDLPCKNLFDVLLESESAVNLMNGDEPAVRSDDETQPASTHGSCADEPAVRIDDETQPTGTHGSCADDSNSNRFCLKCGKVRVSLYYHERCTECFNKYGPPKSEVEIY